MGCDVAISRLATERMLLCFIVTMGPSNLHCAHTARRVRGRTYRFEVLYRIVQHGLLLHHAAQFHKICPTPTPFNPSITSQQV